MLFVLAMDPLQKLIELAARKEFLKQILPRVAKLRCSLYADDATLFANPDRGELQHVNQLLDLFGNCSGLQINMSKTEALVDFPGKICMFPGKYLSFPLYTRRLRRVDIQPLLDKIGGRLPGWKGESLSSAGRDLGEICINRSTNLPRDSVPGIKVAHKANRLNEKEFLMEGR